MSQVMQMMKPDISSKEAENFWQLVKGAAMHAGGQIILLIKSQHPDITFAALIELGYCNMVHGMGTSPKMIRCKSQYPSDHTKHIIGAFIYLNRKSFDGRNHGR
jgi:hypothetical protein